MCDISRVHIEASLSAEMLPVSVQTQHASVSAYVSVVKWSWLFG